MFKLLDINCDTVDEYYYDSEATWDKEVAADVTTRLFTGIVPKIAKYFDRLESNLLHCYFKITNLKSF